VITFKWIVLADPISRGRTVFVPFIFVLLARCSLCSFARIQRGSPFRLFRVHGGLNIWQFWQLALILILFHYIIQCSLIYVKF
jgi:hypothetical protein